MTPLGWHWVLFVWGYAIIWFLLTDRVKLAAYKILDPVKTRAPRTTARPRQRPLRPRPTCPAPAGQRPPHSETGPVPHRRRFR